MIVAAQTIKRSHGVKAAAEFLQSKGVSLETALALLRRL